MDLASWSKNLFSSKSLSTLFLILIFAIVGVILNYMLLWPSANVAHSVYIHGNVSRLPKYGRDKFYNISQDIFLLHSDKDDLADLVAGGKTNRNRANLKPCPETPPGLIGKITINARNFTESVTNDDSLRRVVYGGRYSPDDCVARERTAIIIPYRDREDHLDILTRHLHNILQRQQLEYRIFVIEMALPTQFNRGLLANIGFLFAKETGDFSCFIIHDVDALMMNDKNLYRCGSQPRHLVTGSTKFRTWNDEYGLPYGSYMSGVIALTDSQFTQANGFSNVYFGWGGEDDDFTNRVQRANMKFERPEKDIGIYLAIPHETDSTNPKNPARFGILDASAARQTIEGVNSFYNNRQKIKYKRYAIEYRRYYTWILIGVNEAAITKQYEKYLGEPFAV
ncbi:hypothetical protein CHS0354_009549 [Potamilus streckersoni]|uniref:Beta-1,4-galactosyltransferase n=1 Tax=Potamilus streckersoni TaxID=2493646 RepID=A0AAE0SPK7_9BIVA|nr:hypothetical protein CHS0354_009549 [Potamilus streckersoni]